MKYIAAAVVISLMPAIADASDVVTQLTAPAVQAETAIANQRLLDRANQSIITTENSLRKSMTILPKDDISFSINRIVVNSKDYHFKYLRHALSAYEGESIGQNGIEYLAKELQEQLLRDGFITSRVVVPNQDLTTGLLVFEVIPGYVDEIKLVDSSVRGNWRAAFPIRPKQILKRQDLEQGVDQMRAVIGQDITVSLAPGKKINTSVVLLDIKQTDYIHGGMSIDDAGYKATGKLQGTSFLTISQLTGLQDTVSLSYTKDLESNSSEYGSNQYQVSYRIPHGKTTYTFNTYKYKYHQTIAAITPFLSEGTTRGTEFAVERLLNRTGRTKTSGVMKIIQKERHNYINGIELEVQKQRTTAVELGLTHRKYKGNTVFDIYTFYRQGVPWLGAEEHSWEGGSGNPTSRYHVVGLEGNIQAGIRIGHKQGLYTLRFRSQFTGDRLFGTDQFSIGGRYTVRGFSGEEILRGESGYYLQNEWSLPFSKQSIAPYIALDIGHVWGPSTEWQVGSTLVGSAFGIRGKAVHHVSYDVFIGVPLKRPDGFRADNHVWGFRASYQW